MSKVYGYCRVSSVQQNEDRQLIAMIKKKAAIWNINSLAEFYMQIFEKHRADYRHDKAIRRV